MSTLKTQMWKWEGRGRKGEGAGGGNLCVCAVLLCPGQSGAYVSMRNGY